MSTMCSTLLFVLALAVVPVLADEKVSAGDVTFECKVTGSAKDGFVIGATNSGKSDKKCKASCTLTKKDGSTQTWKYEKTVKGVIWDAPQIQYFYGESGISGGPLSNPEVKASCE